MATFYTEGIILQHTNFREADRLLNVYTKEHGKLSVMARGVRKISSKLAGSLEPFTSVKLRLASGRSFPTVASAEVLHNFRKIKNNENKIFFASGIGSIIERSSHGHQRDQRIFDLLTEVFTFIESAMDADKFYRPVAWYFVWKYLGYLGYQPELADCLSCHRPITGEPTFFHLPKGGLICQTCHQPVKDGQPVSRNAIKVLRLIYSQDLKMASRLRIDDKLGQELTDLTSQYLNYTQEADFKLTQFFQNK